MSISGASLLRPLSTVSRKGLMVLLYGYSVVEYFYPEPSSM